ncbi:HAMP domain-containing sensor histidine kinase [Chryseosolibacter indicus]|uniref:histidine kinase n=1 Tax=Chryseosolibacter indicus TaxID=2782351 RepID=A0ABS5VSA5_9BACT|nr:HAMP domain-containing sensor histidine kinase [Chryseosolibacter indicus]MBT1703913.1 HAMP domain-containing histidine kinase [Chryseosolibacter indicus]
MRIRTKISLVFTLITAATILFLSGFVYVVSFQHSLGFFFTRLKVRATISAESHFEVNGESSTRVREIRERHLQRLPQEEEFFFNNDSSVYNEISKVLPKLPETFVDEVKRSGVAEYSRGFLRYAGIKYTTENGDHIVVARAYDESGEDQMTFLRNILLAGSALSCVFVFGLGQLFAKRIMRPISSIVSKVHGITASNLNDRLDEAQGDDELAEMAGTFNDMLDRLETTFELQSNFISNASHELRTPLTAILGEAEIILALPRNQEDYVKSIRTIQYEAKKLEDVTTSLLRLSQISFDGKKQKIEPVLMDELLMSIKITLDKRMPGNQVKVLVQHVDNNPDFFTIVCVRVWMELALINIIQNSIKYSDNKEVLVTLSAGDGDFFVHISDYGIGIPPEEIRHIFEPFFRASNTFKYEGHGIGLPLAARIIRLHGGRINIHSKTNAGTKVTLQFQQSGEIKT